jgi:hypothetical protein
LVSPSAYYAGGTRFNADSAGTAHWNGCPSVAHGEFGKKVSAASALIDFRRPPGRRWNGW